MIEQDKLALAMKKSNFSRILILIFHTTIRNQTAVGALDFGRISNWPLVGAIQNVR